MAVATQNVENLSGIAGEDLRNNVYHLVRYNSAGKLVKTTTATDLAIGVLAVAPRTDADSTDRAVTYSVLKGRLIMVANAAVTVGQVLVPATVAGRVNPVANVAAIPAGGVAVGVALSPATAAGQLIEVQALHLTGN